MMAQITSKSVSSQRRIISTQPPGPASQELIPSAKQSYSFIGVDLLALRNEGRSDISPALALRRWGPLVLFGFFLIRPRVPHVSSLHVGLRSGRYVAAGLQTGPSWFRSGEFSSPSSLRSPPTSF